MEYGAEENAVFQVTPCSKLPHLTLYCNCIDTKLAQPPYTSRARLNRFEAGFKPPPGSGLQTGLRTSS